MADVKENGDASTPSSGSQSAGASPPPEKNSVAKSVISISGEGVTIVSTGKDGRSRSPRVSTTPLRTSPRHDPSLSGTCSVSTRIKDTQFVSALTQQFQASGTLSAPTGFRRSAPPSSSTPSSLASHSRSSSSSSGIGEDLTSKLSSMLLQQQQQQQQQQQRQQQQPEAEQRLASPAEDKSGVSDPLPPSLPPPSEGVNGRDSGASSPDLPPPPPSSALLRSVSEQPELRKVDASYSPRPKSYTTQNPASSGNGNPRVHNKNDLMSALTAVVTSGSPVAGLRKTRGPGKVGGVTEVYSSKKTSGSVTPTSANK